MIITSRGKPIAILTSVCETNLEETLKAIRRSVAVASVNSMQEQSARAGCDKLSLKEINTAIACMRSRQKACRSA